MMQTIGVFDSGIGGLTVLHALRQAMPMANYIYLGDTARLPYGTKSPATVARYAVQAATQLVAQNIDMLVVACNTASAQGLVALREAFPQLPVLGVIEPGAKAALAATRNNNIAVIATEGTVKSGAYGHALRRLHANVQVRELPTALLVAMAEEGWVEGAEVEAVLRRYFQTLFNAPAPDTLVLGCTHFPLLQQAIKVVLPAGVQVIDSAQATAREVQQFAKTLTGTLAGNGSLRLLATDGPERFARLAERFLGTTLSVHDIELIDL